MLFFNASSRSESEFDRNQLHQIRANFLALSEYRLSLAKEDLTDTQRLFLDVLPCLFHYNHPMLPGYCMRSTPSGLDSYTPKGHQIRQLRRITKSFYPGSYKNQQPKLLSLFTMGSFGTIAQNEKSDIDLWLCYHPDLSSSAITQLRQKADKICEWAQRWHLDVTVFLMNDKAFREGQRQIIDKESSGSTQHLLLLDEFFRTSIYLGGILPAWIFLKETHTLDYQTQLDTLLEKRLLPDKRLLDFGPITNLPANEFIGAAIWQLYKAIESPYKAIIKLMLIEAYAKHPNELTLLSSQAKEFLMEHNPNEPFELGKIDPYKQLYSFVENYLLETQQTSRLTLFRRCFFLKILQPTVNRHQEHSEKSRAVANLISTWDWSDKDIEALKPSQWRLDRVLEERRIITEELNHSYYLLMDYFREQGAKMAASNRELNVLGRKLQAAFSRKAGKIDWINPVATKNIAEEKITFSRNGQSWQAELASCETILKKSSLVELMTWLHCNDVSSSNTKISVDASLVDWVKKIHYAIQQHIPTPMSLAAHQAFTKTSQVKKVLYFIHFDHTATLDKNALATIDVLMINSWNEITCYRYQDNLLLAFLNSTIQSLTLSHCDVNTDVKIYFSLKILRDAFGDTFSHWHKTMTRFFMAQPNGRFVIKSREKYYQIQLTAHDKKIITFDHEEELLASLGEMRAYYSPLLIDNISMKASVLYTLCHHNREGQLQVFYRRRALEADMTIIDSFGTFYFFVVKQFTATSTLPPLQRFLRNVSQRNSEQCIQDISPVDILPIRFYEITDGENGWRAKNLTVPHPTQSPETLNIEAIAFQEKDKITFTFYCQSNKFIDKDESEEAYQAFAHYLNEKSQSQRQNHHKPLQYHIIDMDISQCPALWAKSDQFQLSDYLNAKTLLEKRLDHALRLANT